MNDNNTQTDNLGILNEAQKQGQGTSMKDLVFDPVTGEFRQQSAGTSQGDGQVVTDMTEEGFAA